MKIPDNLKDNKVIIAFMAAVIIVILAMISLFSAFSNFGQTSDESGGSGSHYNTVLILNGYEVKDNYGAGIGEQLSLTDQDTIRGLVLNKYLASTGSEEKDVYGSIGEPITRVFSNKENYLVFTVSVDGLVYSVKIDYKNNRKVVVTDITD